MLPTSPPRHRDAILDDKLPAIITLNDFEIRRMACGSSIRRRCHLAG